MILVETSAWVEYDRATGSAVDERLAELIGGEGPIATTEPVIMELLAGARDDHREAELRRLLLRFPLLAFDPAVDFDGAVRVYRTCRQSGVTPRGLIDCLIATVAIRTGSAVLTADRDFAPIAEVMALRLDEAPP